MDYSRSGNLLEKKNVVSYKKWLMLIHIFLQFSNLVAAFGYGYDTFSKKPLENDATPKATAPTQVEPHSVWNQKSNLLFDSKKFSLYFVH